MKHSGLFSLIFSLLLINIALSLKSFHNQEHLQSQLLFQKFITDFQKFYESEEEYQYRLGVFLENLEKFQAHNADPSSTFTMGVTPFADMKPQEAYEALGLQTINLEGLQKLDYITISKELAERNIVVTLDWSALGLVPQVADSQDTRVGINYILTYAIDSSKSLKDQALILDNYSVKELIDCTSDLESALEFTVSKGLESEADYKSSGTCGYNPQALSLYVKEWNILRSQLDIVTQMELSLQKQPLVALMNAESGNFLYYSGGVIDVGCPTEVVINHALLLVGYDIGENYWKLQNSWGRMWGEEGYVRIKRGVNICGIEQFILSPQLY